MLSFLHKILAAPCSELIIHIMLLLGDPTKQLMHAFKFRLGDITNIQCKHAFSSSLASCNSTCLGGVDPEQEISVLSLQM